MDEARDTLWMDQYEARDALWNTRFHQLQEYKRVHGHCKVAQNTNANTLPLFRWVRKQRLSKRKNKLSDEREAKLNAIGGFAWGKSRRAMASEWENRLEQLKEYKKVNGDCNISKSNSHNSELASWVTLQRQAMQKNELNEERKVKLNSIGFVWKIGTCVCNSFWNTKRLLVTVTFHKCSILIRN
jgi:hypothetical protein